MGRINKKIKILYTIPNFNTAGSGKVLYDLARGLDPNCFEVSIACHHKKGTFFKTVEALGFPIYIINTTVRLRPYFNLWNRIKPFKTFVKQHQFDIVHSWHWSSDWSEVVASRLGGAKFIYTKKAMTWGNKHWKIRSYFSHFIITINDEMFDYFPNRRNQRLIPLGIDTNYYNPKHFETKPTADFTIVTVANLVPVKGIEVLIESLSTLTTLPIRLQIVGDAQVPYAQTLKQLVKRLNLEGNVDFCGKQQDVRPFLFDSDLYVIPTLDAGRKEGMPMALVEAMAMGVPVLGSDISGIRYVLQDFPELLFEASNVNALREKILSIYSKSQSEREQLGKRLQNYCMKHFTMNQFIISHETLYKELAKRN